METDETGKSTVYNEAISKTGKFMKQVTRKLDKSEIIHKASSNLIPLFLISIGAGMLLFGRGTSERRTADYNYNRRRRRSLATGEADDSTLRNAGKKISGAANSVYETATDKASSAYDTAANFADSVGGIVSDGAGNVLEAVETYGGKAHEQYEYYIEENPLAVGAIALVAGAIIGLAIPSTEYEDRMMGETRENLFSKATDRAGETVEKVKNVAVNTLTSVREDVVEKAGEIAENVVDKAVEEARDKNLVEDKKAS